MSKKRYCIDCGQELRGHGAPIRCRSCAAIERMKDPEVLAKIHSPESRAKRSRSMKKTCSDPRYREHMSEMRCMDWEEGKFDHVDWSDVEKVMQHL